MRIWNWYKELPWPVYHNSYIAQGILQICVALIVSCVFPVVLENSKAANTERIEYIKKKEEMYVKFCSSFSMSLTLNDEIRACHQIISCENNPYYRDRCKEIVSKGSYEFASMKEPLDVVCNVVGMYYSNKVATMLKEMSSKATTLLSYGVIECGHEDDAYAKLFKELSGVDYPAVMELMRSELAEARN